MPPAIKRRVACDRCQKALVLMPGDVSTSCKDRAKCDERAGVHTQPTQAPTIVNDGSAQAIATEQRSLAVRAVKVTHQVIDKIEAALADGVEVTLKDGSTAMQQVQPMALASILRELRPTVHEPVRAAEQQDVNSRPLIQLDLGDPDVVRSAVAALRSRRERQLAASQQTVEMVHETTSTTTLE